MPALPAARSFIQAVDPAARLRRRLAWKGWFWTAAAVLLAVMGWRMVVSARLETQSWDEGIHLAAGYSYWKEGDFRLNVEHPPLGKLLNALPLLPLDPHLHVESEAWGRADQIQFGKEFLYRNRIPADVLLFRARVVTILLTLLLGGAIAFWSRRHFGGAAGLLALGLFSLDPNFIAHGRYVTTDVIVALMAFVACAAWNRFLRTGSGRDLLLAALLLGLALSSKFSALFLIPVFAGLYLLRWFQLLLNRWSGNHVLWPVSFGRALKALPVLVVVCALVVGAMYWDASRRSLKEWGDDRAPKLSERLAMAPGKGGETSPTEEVLSFAARLFDLPVHPYLIGLNDVAIHGRTGQDTYLLGQTSKVGWWYYFPVAFAVKTPLAVHLLTILAACFVVAVCARAEPRKIWAFLKALPFEWIVLAVPFAVYWALTLTTRLNLGVRHLLPTYPFLYITVAALIVQAGRKVLRRGLVPVLASLLALLVYESAGIHPHYLAFFNFAAGGPRNGPRYLLDSNIDWGQDVKKLKRYMDAHGIPQVCISYFGNADLVYYGVGQAYLPMTREIQAGRTPDCTVAAVSVTVLHDLYVEPGNNAWLREKQAFETIGYSIYLFDVSSERAPGR